MGNGITPFGLVANVRRDAGCVSCDYVSLHNSGLYSNISSALHDAIALHRAGIAVRRIDFSTGMCLFKDATGRDVYPLFFDASREEGAALSADLTFDVTDVHKVYKHLPLRALSKAAGLWFKPSRKVFDVAHAAVKAAGVEPAKTIAICYRGTDKGKEVSLASIDQFIAVAESIEEVTDRDFDILIQTDQAQARHAIIDRFGPRARFFRDLPVTTGSAAIHNLEFGTHAYRSRVTIRRLASWIRFWRQNSMRADSVELTREDFAIRIMAAVVVMSQCAYVITYTGNIGAWIAILRGSTQNLYQFDASGQLRMP